MTFFSNRQIGNNAEELACEYLKKQGYKILARNFFIRGGEIDIIAKDCDVLAFVEVKARYSKAYGYAREAVTPWKLRALQKTALFYIQKQNLRNIDYRLDLVAIDFDENKNPHIELIKNIYL